MSQHVVVVAFPGVSPFQLSVPALIFQNEKLSACAGYDVRMCAETPGTLLTDAGIEIVVPHGLDSFAEADTIVIPSWRLEDEPSDALLVALHRAHARGARIVGLCLGAFVIAAAGLVDGREATTHWSAAETLRRRRPAVRVCADLLWSDHGDVVTSAGVVAAVDCCLHLVRSDYGAAVANEVARAIVLAPHRDGSQAQFVRAPVPDDAGNDDLGAALLWAIDRLDEAVDIDRWAAVARQSRRSFTRNFRRRTGTSPKQWLLAQRLDRARILLETTSSTVEAIATTVGFRTAASLRQHFAQRYSSSPHRYRTAFRERPEVGHTDDSPRGLEPDGR